jgi:hypothetical protein
MYMLSAGKVLGREISVQNDNLKLKRELICQLKSYLELGAIYYTCQSLGPDESMLPLQLVMSHLPQIKGIVS